MRNGQRVATTLVAVPVFLALGVGAAFAHQCTNASKPADAGWRVLFGPNDSITFNDAGLARQFATDAAAAIERFSGQVGIDLDGDGDAEFTTYIVGPESELPHEAQQNGAECKGIVNVGDYFACAMA